MPDREELFVTPDELLRELGGFGVIEMVVVKDEAEIAFPIRGPEIIDRDIKQLRRIASRFCAGRP